MKTKVMFTTALFACFAGLSLAAAEFQSQPTGVPAGAGSAADNRPAPKIQFSSVAYDFGKVKQGEVIKHDFIFTNVGASTLEITDVKPGCGCTTAGSWDKKVEPGKTGSIPLQFNSSGFGGSVSKSAIVTCNDPSQATLSLTLNGTVWKPIDMTPSVAMFQVDSEDQTNQTKVLRIVSNVEEPVRISDVRSTNPQFKTELKELKPGKEFELAVSIVPPFTNVSAFANISLTTSSLLSSNLTVSAYVTVQQPVTVAPPQIMLPAGPLVNAYTSTVTIYYRGTNSLKVSEPALSIPEATTTVKEVQPGKMYTLLTVFPAGFQANSAQRMELTAKTDHPKHPVLKVPIYQTVAAKPAAAPTGTPALQPQNVPASQRSVPVRALPETK